MLDTAITAATKAGDLVRDAFYQPGFATHTFKEDRSIVTDLDVASEDTILGILKSEFPDHAFFSEEAGSDEVKSDYRWVIDPIDGTSNFRQCLPYFAVSIALLLKDEPFLGVVYNPILNQLFTAEMGKGAFLNGEPISPSNLTSLSTGIVVMSRGAGPDDRIRQGSNFNLMLDHARTVRIMGSTALDLCYAACGRFDAYVGNGIKFYDCAAGALIAKEAGAHLSTFSGKPFSWTSSVSDIIVSNSALSGDLHKLLKNT